jgi:TonB family protein
MTRDVSSRMSRESERRRFWVAGTVALLVHGGLGIAMAYTPVPTPHAAPADPDRLQVDTFSQDVSLPKPKIIPPVEPEPIERPEPPKAPEKAMAQPTKPAPAPKPSPRRKKKQRKKTVQGPKTLVLSSTLQGGSVQVYGGGEDVLGDPSVEATPESTTPAPEAPADVAPDGNGSGQRVEAPPKLVMPRIKVNFPESKKRYPKDAPRIGRPIHITLTLVVKQNGRVRAIRIVKRSPSAKGLFDAEARRVGNALVFYPATLGGKPIERRIRWTVTFRP